MAKVVLALLAAVSLAAARIPRGDSRRLQREGGGGGGGGGGGPTVYFSYSYSFNDDDDDDDDVAMDDDATPGECAASWTATDTGCESQSGCPAVACDGDVVGRGVGGPWCCNKGNNAECDAWHYCEDDIEEVAEEEEHHDEEEHHEEEEEAPDAAADAEPRAAPDEEEEEHHEEEEEEHHDEEEEAHDDHDGHEEEEEEHNDDMGVCSGVENGKVCSDSGWNWCCDKDSNYPTCGNSRGICVHKSAKKTAKKVAMGLIIGVVVAALAVLGGIIACCFCCAGCPGYKSRHPQGAKGAPPCIEDQPTAVVEMSAK